MAVSDKIVIISAPSGTGKNTILDALTQRRPNIRHSISTTTRCPRPHEVHGKHYYFLSKEEFQAKIKKRHFWEYAKVFDNYYGTTFKEISRIQKQGNIPILDIDVQGFQQIRKKKPDVVSIFIAPPSLEELEKRLIRRGTETKEQIQHRLKLAEDEMRYKDHYQYVIVNDDLDRAVDAAILILETLEEGDLENKVHSSSSAG